MDNNEISTIESTPETNVTKKKKQKKWFVPVIIVVALLFLISAAGIFAVINITKNQIRKYVSFQHCKCTYFF